MESMIVEVGLDSNELEVVIRALICYERELQSAIEVSQKSLQTSIDAGNILAVDKLAKMIHRTRIEFLNAEGIRLELNPGMREGKKQEVGRIVIIDQDQTKIE